MISFRYKDANIPLVINFFKILMQNTLSLTFAMY